MSLEDRNSTPEARDANFDGRNRFHLSTSLSLSVLRARALSILPARRAARSTRRDWHARGRCEGLHFRGTRGKRPREKKRRQGSRDVDVERKVAVILQRRKALALSFSTQSFLLPRFSRSSLLFFSPDCGHGLPVTKRRHAHSLCSSLPSSISSSSSGSSSSSRDAPAASKDGAATTSCNRRADVVRGHARSPPPVRPL